MYTSVLAEPEYATYFLHWWDNFSTCQELLHSFFLTQNKLKLQSHNVQDFLYPHTSKTFQGTAMKGLSRNL